MLDTSLCGELELMTTRDLSFIMIRLLSGYYSEAHGGHKSEISAWDGPADSCSGLSGIWSRAEIVDQGLYASHFGRGLYDHGQADGGFAGPRRRVRYRFWTLRPGDKALQKGAQQRSQRHGCSPGIRGGPRK